MKAEDAAQAWFKWRARSGTVATKTRVQDRDRVSRFVVAVGDRPFGPGAVRVWAATLGTLAPASRRAHASTVRTWLAWCETEGLASSGTAAAVPRYRVPASVPRALSADERDAVLAHVHDDRARLAVALMLGIGLRLHEVTRLTTSDVDLRAATVLVRGKGSHERLLPLPQRCRVMLAEVCHSRPAGAPLVCSQRGTELSTSAMSRLIRQAMEDAGVKRAPRDGRSAHCLRHTCASEVLEAGAPLHVVRELLGHSNIATTSIYLRRAGLGQLRDAVAHR